MRAPGPIRRRSYARLVLAALSLAAFLWTGGVVSAAPPKRIVFPIVGPASYTNDFGDPRGSRSHEGNDLMSVRKAPVVAAEAGRIEIYNRSARAGCMLYLYGRSGTTYLYIHLNNDRGSGNDNRGGCRTGVSYAPGLRDGQSVAAGELIGYVGNSGDANGTQPHLHFELHPGDGGAVSPYPWLRRSSKLLFAIPKGTDGRALQQRSPLTLTGTVVSIGEAAQPTGASSPDAGTGSSPAQPATANGAPPPPPPTGRTAGEAPAGTRLVVKVRSVAVAGSTFRVTRRVTLVIAQGLDVSGLAKGTPVSLTTEPVSLDLRSQRAAPGTLVAAVVNRASRARGPRLEAPLPRLLLRLRAAGAVGAHP